MSFFKIATVYKLFFPVIILSLISFSCSTDTSITDSSNQTNLSKPSEITDYFSDGDGGHQIGYGIFIEKGSPAECLFEKVFKPESFPISQNNSEQENSQKQIGYDFRDNFLVNSKKGNNYIASYYILSDYGIKNNLVMKYSMEHLSLMNTGIEVSQELQHGTDDNQTLINKSTYDELKYIVKIYRESENHNDIDVVLDYLETDLEKYYNKTKAEIAADFEF